jgi:hypothetical protein
MKSTMWVGWQVIVGWARGEEEGRSQAQARATELQEALDGAQMQHEEMQVGWWWRR